MSKKRILMVSEASYTLSGYGTYTREVLSRLHKTGKYEIAEFASYAHVNDPRNTGTPWRLYPNDLDKTKPDPRQEQLSSNPIYQFGGWRFERVLLDFKPDIVFDIRDPWMFMFQNNSPFRRFFHWAIMPTVDSAPQQEEWIQSFAEADGVLTYSDWGLEILKQQGGGRIKLYKSAPPGVDHHMFKPIINSLEHKRKMSFPEDINIVGTIMRNQRRKLFPNLMVAFNLFLDKCREEGNHELARKTFLYFHTSYPDVVGCWNIPRLIKEMGLGHKIFFTYVCRNCNLVFASTFQDARAVCQRCNAVAAILPSVANGLTPEQMAGVINLFDAYTQYATCEGFGMPQVEAAACGVPVFSTDYSAMKDVVRKLDGFPIKVGQMYRAVDEDAWKAIPDNQDFANKLYSFLSLPLSERKRKGMSARKRVEQYYTWDKTAKIWEEYFDAVELTGDQGKWDAPPKFLQPTSDGSNPPNNITNDEFVEWAIANVMGSPDKIDSMMALDMSRALNYELAVATGRAPEFYSKEQVLTKMKNQVKNHNLWEQARIGQLQLSPEDYLEYANAGRSK